MKNTGLIAKLKRFSHNEDGNISLILGLTAIPLVAVAGLAIDMGRITEARSALQQVADGAALAAAAAKGSNAQREQIALSYFNRNMPSLYGVTATSDIDVAGEDVSIKIDAVVEGTLLAVAYHTSSSNADAQLPGGGPVLPDVGFGVGSSAHVEQGESGTRCLIALNTSMADAIYIRGTGDFTTSNCTVHSNSSSASGLHLQGNAEATADKFHVAGNYAQTGGAGWFSVTPEAGKPVVADPYMIAVSDPGGSAVTKSIKKQDGLVSLNATKYSNITISAQGSASFTPGVHYITGTLSLGAQATLTGTNVTLVLLGSNARIDMNSGGTIKLQAPSTGTYPGFAIIGDKSATTVQTNTVQGGAGSYFRGIVYTPKHKLYVTGGGDFNADSSYPPMVVDNIEIGGNGAFTIGMSHTDYGYSKPTQLDYVTQSKARLTD